MTDDERHAAARAHFQQGLADLNAHQPAAAEAALRQSLSLLPGRPSTLTNLAVALLRQGRAAEALPLLDAVLAQQPDDVDALGHRGVALASLQRLAEAGATFDRVLALAPDRPEAWFHHGQTLQAMGRADAALDSYDRCLALMPDHARAHSQRGAALHDLGRGDEAAQAFERALALGDDAELNAWYLASLQRAPMPAAAPRGWVTALFDDYAADFDRHLQDTLGYRAPEVLARLLLAAGTPPFGTVLDLGCGTGLAGARLRAMAGQLHGVDLSAAMLDAARARGCYDMLHQADAVEHLARLGPASLDVVVAADVFIYLGALAPVLAAVQRALRPQGLLAFSLEPAPDAQDVVLQPSLRYAHGEAPLRALAARLGYDVRTAERGVLRQDDGGDVPGLYLVLQRR